ncbi:MAG TPA: thioredoxin family protein [Gemmatimonadaceae bacterium]
MTSGMSTCGVDEKAHTIAERFRNGSTFDELLARPKSNGDMWHAVYKRASLAPEAIERAKALSVPAKLLVLNEDWCGDSVNSLPYVARLVESSDCLEMRIIGRDDNRDLMDLHLTGASRSIPVVIVYDSGFREHGWWGPRPGPLQQWMMTEGLALPKPDRYPLVRAWYARDRGKTIVSEILSIIEKLNG